MNILADISTRQITVNKTAIRIFAVSTMIISIILGSYIRIPLPFTPVPLTLQTFFVIMGAALLGRKYASISILSYIGLGAAGVPVFQGYGSGILHLFGPTGGYIAGFVAAVLIIGGLFNKADHQLSTRTTLLYIALGQTAIYTLGVLWLSIILKLDLRQALYLGVVPFLPGAAFKAVAATVLYQKIGRKIHSALT